MRINGRVWWMLAWWWCLAFAPSAQAGTVEYTLTIAKQPLSVTGQPSDKITINGTLPGPVLRFNQGDEAIVHVINAMAEETSIHWHGLIIPGGMDGAPGFNHFAAIKPGGDFTYRFPVRQAGTYWYHAHSLGQEQDGLYGAIVIAPEAPDPAHSDRDYVVLLSDYSAESAADILAHLKMSSDYYQYRRRTVFDFLADAGRDGLKSALSWGKMRMSPTDLSDVSGYDFLINGMTTGQNWTGLFQPGERVRLRIVNAATMTIFDLRIPGLKMMVVAADGHDVEPVAVDEMRIGTAETYDVIVRPMDDKAYGIVAESLDREGFAAGTLAPGADMRVPLPPHRARALLTQADMDMEQMMADDPDMDMADMASGWAETGAPKGAKTLSYDDLRARQPQSDTREPTREIVVRLGGSMNRYVWTINGKTFRPEDQIPVAFNERVRLTYINQTMMAHPIHLHGMFVQMDNGQPPDRLPSKHTIIVPPGQTVSALLTADQPGAWPLHCHLLYHMAAGMMTTLSVGEGDGRHAH